MLSYFGDAYLSSGYGMGNSMLGVFFNIIMVTSCEALGIICTKDFGKKDYDAFLRALYRGFALF